eukprot:TRINITY_DN769_c0_g1_i8.p1 TRINITY_DN769_c0_g1~~TRINITY_DN769_c0_g1_i8.p1  ORF type:complete len:416 (-),score=114.53 TRINITY_DN769_c0_g1_i8:12-1259(-)
MIRRPPRSTLSSSSAASDVYKRQAVGGQLGNPHVEHTIKLAELNKKIASADTLANDPNIKWSPSPEPTYDQYGKRLNTKGFRMKQKLETQKQALIDEYLTMYPHMRGMPGYQRSKIEKKVYIPVDEFPNYNFFGLIVGPRGSTQKRVERETGAKVIIRGKGSLKEGQTREGDTGMDEPMHVLITGETQESVDKAAREVDMMINPDTDQHQEHKARQLQELAVLNGTLRDDTCYLCGQRGHRQQDCPDRNRAIKVNVKCAICGDGSHPTHDCPLKRSGADKLIIKSANLEDEYDSFMAELEGKPAPSGGAAQAAPSPGAPPGALDRKELPPWLQPANQGAPVGRMQMGAPPPWAGGAPMPGGMPGMPPMPYGPVSYTHLRAHETPEHLVCRLLLEKKKKKDYKISDIYLIRLHRSN